MDCIFCKIVSGEIPSGKVYEDGSVIAFMDINPAKRGHCLVLPKEHYESIFDVSDEVLYETILAVKKVASAVQKAVKSDGVNILQNNNRAAGQLIPHIHFHVIPRFNGDGIDFSYRSEKYAGGEMAELLSKIKSNI
jgi:histidine triad (HIT) family protein